MSRRAIAAFDLPFLVEPIDFLCLIDDVFAKQLNVGLAHMNVARASERKYISLRRAPPPHNSQLTYAKTTASAGSSVPSLSTRLFLAKRRRDTPLLTLIFPSAIKSAAPLSIPNECARVNSLDRVDKHSN